MWTHCRRGLGDKAHIGLKCWISSSPPSLSVVQYHYRKPRSLKPEGKSRAREMSSLSLEKNQIREHLIKLYTCESMGCDVVYLWVLSKPVDVTEKPISMSLKDHVRWGRILKTERKQTSHLFLKSQNRGTLNFPFFSFRCGSLHFQLECIFCPLSYSNVWNLICGLGSNSTLQIHTEKQNCTELLMIKMNPSVCKIPSLVKKNEWFCYLFLKSHSYTATLQACSHTKLLYFIKYLPISI